MINKVKNLLEENWEYINRIRKSIHENPEIGYEEYKTAETIRNVLNKYKIENRKIYETGIVGIQKGVKTNKTIAIRADMDALKIQEETGVDFASKNDGIMHACGHDAHVTMVLGTAIIMSQIRDHLNGNIKYIFQPAEEKTGGAEGMIKNGVMENPNVDRILGMHVWPGIVSGGGFGVCNRETMASYNVVKITLRGKGGHISSPHTSNNPIYVGIQLINTLMMMRTQTIDPLENLVFDVASVHSGGYTSNIIPEEFLLIASIRTYNTDLTKSIHKRLIRILDGYVSAYGITYDLEYSYGFDPVLNNEKVAEEYRKSASKIVGTQNVGIPKPNMGADDFSEYLKYAPGAFGFLGINQDEDHQLHSSKFIVDEESIKKGILIFCQSILDYFEET